MKKNKKNLIGEVVIELPKTIVKRDGRVVAFEVSKIERAIRRCFEDLDKEPSTTVEELAHRVVNIILAKYNKPTVEQVQDTVEIVLQAAGEFAAAKNYILYRAEHAKVRDARPIPKEVSKAFAESDILDLITTLEGERLGKKPLIELLIIYVNFPERSWRLAFTNELEILSWK